MMKRQPDGTWRNARRPVVVSPATLRARWIESEVVHLKLMGLSFDAIAEQIARVGRGQGQAMTSMPEGVTFPPDYTISRQACQKAYKKANAREPALGVAEMRKLDTARCEECVMNLQPGIRKGEVRSTEALIKVLGHKAKINGYWQSNPEVVLQTDAGGEKRKSQAEIEAEGAKYIDLFTSAYQMLADLGVPMPQTRERPQVNTGSSVPSLDRTNDKKK
jgi:hypothetical protein